jgi:predicted TIM-barrel fold metal-dependent hydrolase
MQLTEVDREESSQEEVLDSDLPIVDPHHHLWPPGYRIPYDLAALEADFRRGHNVEATVFMECMTSFRPDGDEALRPVGETEFVVGAAGPRTSAGTDVAAGIVGWADLMKPDEAARTLDGHVEAGGDRFRGVRFNVVWHDRHSSTAHAGRPTEAHMLLDGRFRAGLREVARRGLTYDVWLYHPQLAELAATLDAVPELTFIVNHLGGPVPDEATPEARAEIFGDWQRNLNDVARRPNVVLKIGGMGMPVYGFGYDVTGRPGSTALANAWRPSVEAAIEAFGAERCMFESNFPVDKQSFSYDSLWNAFKMLTTGCSPQERAMLFAGTARRVYRLPSSHTGEAP